MYNININVTIPGDDEEASRFNPEETLMEALPRALRGIRIEGNKFYTQWAEGTITKIIKDRN